MEDKVLLDTSYLVALLDERDTHHKDASAIHKCFGEKDVVYIYLDCVLNETATVLTRRALERKADPVPAIRRLRKEIPPEVIDWTGAEWPRFWESTMDCMEKYRGRLSFIDSLLVIIAAETGIRQIVSFDQNFDSIPNLKRISSPVDIPVK